MKKQKEEILYGVHKTDEDPQILFDKAVKLCLEGGMSAKRDEIVKLFICSYLNENNIDHVGFGVYNRDLLEPTQGLCDEEFSDVFVRKSYFKSQKFLTNDITLLFHELEHCKTFYLNQKKSWFRGRLKDNTCDGDFPLYLSSPGEHNSRLAEVTYFKRFVESAERLFSENTELKTKRNEKILKKLRTSCQLHEDYVDEQYSKALKRKNSMMYRIVEKNKAKSTFKRLQKLEHKYENPEEYIDTKYEINKILDYMKSYRDEKFATEVLEYIKNNKFGFLAKTLKVSDIFESGTIPFSRDKLDEILFTFPRKGLSRELNGEDLGKHNLLFYGSVYATSFAGLQGEGMAKVEKEFCNYTFKGLPIKRTFDGFAISINGKEKHFQIAEDAYIEVSKHINLTILDDFSEKKLEEINSIFGEDVVIITPKQIVNKKEGFDMR